MTESLLAGYIIGETLLDYNSDSGSPAIIRAHIESTESPVIIKHWVRAPLAWKNLKRIADGLGILHSQGVVHRNLTAWSVFTSGSSDPDFQLSGFEFSLRLSSRNNKKDESQLRTEVSGPYSFREDWRAFGQLAAQVINIAPEVILSESIHPASLTPPGRCIASRS